MNPTDLRYSDEHEWVRVESNGLAVLGITEFAAESLGDIVFIELPEVDTHLSQSDKLGEIESVKAVGDLFSPVSGRVVERNEEAVDNPERVNENPYESGWLLKLEPSDLSELKGLMTAAQYDVFLAAQESQTH